MENDNWMFKLYREEIFFRLLYFCLGVAAAGGAGFYLQTVYPEEPLKILTLGPMEVTRAPDTAFFMMSCLLLCAIGSLMLVVYGLVRSWLSTHAHVKGWFVPLIGGVLHLAVYVGFNFSPLFHTATHHHFWGPFLIWSWILVWPVAVTEIQYALNCCGSGKESA